MVNNLAFVILQREENVSIVVPHQHHCGEEMDKAITCAMLVVYITR